jgi:hypothetical protein
MSWYEDAWVLSLPHHVAKLHVGIATAFDAGDESKERGFSRPGRSENSSHATGEHQVDIESERLTPKLETRRERAHLRCHRRLSTNTNVSITKAKISRPADMMWACP